MMLCRNTNKAWAAGLLLLLCTGCPDVVLNNTFPLGGDVAGGRGITSVIFVNETPYRAIFTFGVYDPQDQTSVPQFAQFAVDPEQDETPFNRGLAADTVTERGTFTANCGRVLSLGGQEMINRIESEEATPVNQAPVIEDALRAGVFFTAARLDDPDANAVENPAITLGPTTFSLGVDYTCDALLIVTFRLDPADANRVLVDLDAIEAEED